MNYADYPDNVDNKENRLPNRPLHETHKAHNTNKRKKSSAVKLQDFQSLEAEVTNLRAQLKLNNNLNTKVKTELLQVSKKETEEYANNIEIYANEFTAINKENETLKKEINSYKQQLQTLAHGIEQHNDTNRRKTEQINKLQRKNMSLQHEKVLLQQKMQLHKDNFINDDELMRILCQKLEVNTNDTNCDSNYKYNFNGLLNFVSDSKRCMYEYSEMKQELITYRKQIEIMSENKGIGKEQLIHFESLRSENENLRKEIRILEESNNKLANDLIERSEKKMTLMTESLNKMQLSHNKAYSEYDKKIEKIKREKKVYQHKCEHFKKETKGFATKYEDLTKKYVTLQQQLSLYKNNDDNISEDYERRMTSLESNNDALNQQLQSGKHEMKELRLLNEEYKSNLQKCETQLFDVKRQLEYSKNSLSQLKASKALMETMWNEFKDSQTQNNESLLNNLESKIEKMHGTQYGQFNKEIQEYKHEIYALKQQINAQKIDREQNEEIGALQEQNYRLTQQISEMRCKLGNGDESINIDRLMTQSNDSSLMAISNSDTLKQRLMELKKENIRLHQELVGINRNIENKDWEMQLNEQNLKNDIQILETKLCHSTQQLKDKLLEIKEMKKLLGNTEGKLEEIRNKYESIMQLNVKYESENSNLQIYNQSLKANISEHKNEIQALRSSMDQKYGNIRRHSTNNELVKTLKFQNNEFRKKMEQFQDSILLSKQEILTLKQSNNTLADRYESNIKIIESHRTQIESLRVSLSDTQKRESKVIKQLNECKLQSQKYKIESQQFKTQIIDKTQLNEKLNQQLTYIQNDNNGQYQQFTNLTNKLEIACTNAEQLKMTNKDMHSQIEYLKKAYEDLDGELNNKETQLRDMQQNYDKILKDMTENKCEMNSNKYQTLQEKYTIISKKYEILKEHWEGLNKEKGESENKLANLELALKNVDGKMQFNEVQIHEETQLLRVKNSNLKQEMEKTAYEIEDLQTKNNEMTQQLNEWKLKYDKLNDRYEFESGQHDNTLKKLNDLRAVWDGETNLNQLLQIKQQTIQELQSKLTENNKLNDELKKENERVRKIIEEQTSMQSSLKTRINVQRNIISEQQQHNSVNTMDSSMKIIKISMDEYQHLQEQLERLTELQNKFEMSQQEINELQHELSKWRDIKQDLDSSEIIPNDLFSNTNQKQTIQIQMEQLVAYLHKKEQSLHDLQDEYEGLKTENNALLNTIQSLKQEKIDVQSKIHSIESQRDSFAKRVRTLSAGNAKLRVELYSISSAADLVQEQLKTSAVALSATTDKKHKLIGQIESLSEALSTAEQQISTLQSENNNIQNYNDKLVSQINTLQSTHGNQYERFGEQRNHGQRDTKVNVSFTNMKSECEKLKKECNKLENDAQIMNIEKSELKKQINELQSKYCALFNEHNSLMQNYQSTNHQIADMKLQKNTVFIEKDLLGYKVERLKGDTNNISSQLNNLRNSYFEQSKKFKEEHNVLYNKYKKISGEREEFKLKIDGLLSEKQTLQSIVDRYRTQMESNTDTSDYAQMKNKLSNAQIKIDELNMLCKGKQNIKDKFRAKTDEYQQLQMKFHEQESKVIKSAHDLQTLLKSYNNLSAENEQLHSENQTLYKQLQTEQINKYVQTSKHETNVILDNDSEMKINSINLQSLVKRGTLLTEQCADLHSENKKLQTNNNELTQTVSDLEQQISALNVNVNDDDSKSQDLKAVVLMQDTIDSNHHKAVLRELRHRNEQLLNQVRSLQKDLETDTELIDRLQKENDELRTKITTLLEHNKHESPQMMIAVNAKGEPWQDIIKGLRKQLQEARREIADLCEESMGKTQHINDVESANAQLLQSLDSLSKEHKQLSDSIAASPKNEEIAPQNSNEYGGKLAKEYARNEELCIHMQSMITRINSEKKTKQELTNKFNELQNSLVKTKTELLEIEQNKNNLSKRNEIISHELSLLKRAKGQLSNHNEELAKEITNLQSIHFEQQQKISVQSQEISELQTLYQNVQSQMEIKQSLNEQFHNERQQIIQLFAVTDILQPIDEESKLESMENRESNGRNNFEALDIKHEIEHLLGNYQKLMHKNAELQRNIERNHKQYLMETDFNEKFEEIKQLLIDKNQRFLSTANSDENGNENRNNGSAQMQQPKLTLSPNNLSPFRYSTGGLLNLSNPDLNTSVQCMEEIMHSHKLMKEEERAQLLQCKKELMTELDAVNVKYNTLSREYASQSQKLLLLEQSHKHISNQLQNVSFERDSLKSEINKNKTLTDKLSKDFKSIGIERDRLYEKIKLLQNTQKSQSNESEYHRLREEINELNDLNMKQFSQIELLQTNNNKNVISVKQSQKRYDSIKIDFQTIKSKYEKLNEECDTLQSAQQKLYYEINELKQINQQKTIQTNELKEIICKNKQKNELSITEYQTKITELQLLLDSFKFESIAKESNESNKHISDLNEQLALLKQKYESRLKQCKAQYNDKINKMNEAITKLSGVRTKLQTELIDKDEKAQIQIEYLKDELNKEITAKQTLANKVEMANRRNVQFDRKIESALKQKVSVDKELAQLQTLHNTNNDNISTKFEDLLMKYQQSVQENGIIKVAKEQHSLLMKQIDHLHSQLKQSQSEQKQLRNKAQTHYLRRKEEWKKLKQLEMSNNGLMQQIKEYKSGNKEISAICGEISAMINHKKSVTNIVSFLKEMRKEISNKRSELQELFEKFTVIEHSNKSLQSQIITLNTDIQELEDENSELRQQKSTSHQSESQNNTHLSEKINLQRQIRIVREERDIAEKKLKENKHKNKQLSLKVHQFQLQFESLQQRYNTCENESMKVKKELSANEDIISTLQAEKTSLSQKNNELYDNNINLEDTDRKSQQEIGKYQVKSDRLRQQRDYAKSKYKELKAKFNSLEQQFRSLQSRFNQTQTTQTTSQTLPF